MCDMSPEADLVVGLSLLVKQANKTNTFGSVRVYYDLSKYNSQMIDKQKPHEKKATPFKCDSCEEDFIANDSLVRHKTKIHGAKPVQCNLCEQSFALNIEKAAHREPQIKCEAEEEDDVNKKDDVADVEEEETDAPSENPLHNLVTMETAREIEANTPVEESIEFGDEDAVNDDKDNVEKDKNMFCYHCGIGFTDNPLYQFHKMFHGSPNPFHCSNCGIELDDKYEFNAHLVLFSHGSRSV
ncbi:hypothetical protein CAEBREN_24950 [Caenorhabditis brenneri]|uniref:C2H2-type domain-containing protein n=1 Tax=Caenorhabditis brenneri TaxID=135651 RepID=G0NW75_CAEBE|nr:hypothetical protein CAEBREN_24950 [Caenorhabditis brenneri]